jgi:hypothetical protein
MSRREGEAPATLRQSRIADIASRIRIAARSRPALLAGLAAALLYARLLRATPFTADDYEWVYQRIPGYLDALSGGQFPPRTFPFAFNGAGYAFAHFYPPFSHWLAAILAVITGSPVRGVHLSFLAAVVLASVFMFFLARRLGASDGVGLLVSIIYAALPYHVVDVFIRGALAETWAIAWFPAIVLCALRGLDARRASLALAFVVCALILSHAVMALYFGLGCAVALVWIWRERGFASFARTSLAAVTGGALALWYVLPVQESMDLVWVGDPAFMRATEQAVRSNVAGLATIYSVSGLTPWLLIVIAWQLRKGTRRSPWVSRLLVASAAFTAYAYVPGAFQPLLPSQLAYIQFPWRVFSITGFLNTVILALLFGSFRTAGTRALIAALAVAISLPVAVSAGGRRQVDAGFHATGAVTYTVDGDYLPKSVRQADAADMAMLRRQRLEGASIEVGTAGVTVVATDGAGQRSVVLPLHYYPFYTAVTVTGERVPIDELGGYVRMQISNSPVRISVENPRSFWLGLGVGLASLALLVGYRFVASHRGNSPVDVRSRDEGPRRSQSG